MLYQILHLVDGNFIIGKVDISNLSDNIDESHVIIHDPFIIIKGHLDGLPIVILERYGLSSGEVIFNPTTIISIDLNVSKELIEQYILKLSLHKGVLDKELNNIIKDTSNNLKKLFNPNGDVNLNKIKQSLSNNFSDEFLNKNSKTIH